MNPIVISGPGGSSASIAAELGFNCYEFKSSTTGGGVVDVIDSEPGFIDGNKRPSANGIPLLFPFPNRIRQGRFRWDSKDYDLPEDKVGYDGDGNAIHGFCLDRPWRVVNRSDHSVTGEFQLSIDAPDRREFWPADFIIQVTYAVDGPALRSDIRIINPDSKPLPWGFGTHAYFKLPLGPESDPKHCLIQADASKQWPLTACLPDGSPGPVSASADLRDGAYYDVLKLDDVLSGLPDSPTIETKILDEAAGIQVTQKFDSNFRELVVFTPPWTKAVCMEPYTCVTDAINLQQMGVDAGWRVLEPGQEFKTTIEISSSLIVC